ncbi:hypothetical protein EJ04DRAFT_527438 [Polyplosphaeria fusca]|uniref:DUF7580 domain-containing protein n=1 Tax=Polyplosphaeria fusca TaxID=682080 RepID=A0A9P4QQN7_9PLEO|nr:hypothetical protein EJ04DRAFT_527438 [Polyplosphaeria fusca]
MSGIEVAGLVLGALPVLLKAVEQYRGTIRAGIRFVKKRKYVEKLASALLFQQGTLTEVLRTLLIYSGCSDVARLDVAPFDYLNDSQVQAQLHDYLGADIDAALTSALQQSLATIKKIAGNIAGLVPTMNGTTDDLEEIIKANHDAKPRKLDLLPRIKLMFGATELKIAIEEMDTTIASLYRLTSLVCSNRQPTEEKVSRQAINLAAAFRQVRSLASNLHTAIDRGWNARCHHKRHDAHMLLEDRIDTATAISKRMTSSEKCGIPAFHLIFAGTLADHNHSAYRAVVQVMHEDHEEDDPKEDTTLYTSTSHKTSKVTINVPRRSSEISVVSSIDDLCTAFAASGVAFVLTRGQKLGTIQSEKHCTMSCHHNQVTFEELLTESNPARGPMISLKLRMVLALKLASNLLQLLQTQWLHAAWSKELISFPIMPSQGPRASNIDFSRPYVSSTFDHANSATKLGQPSSVEPKIAMLELGILLLEIWHEKTLEAQFSLTKTPVKYHERLALALEWIHETDNPLLELYDKAVTFCLTGVVSSESRNMQWDDMKLWAAICGDVIEPLSKNCKQWR